MRVTVQDAGGDKLVKDTNDKWREHREDDVVQRERPGFVCDLAREVVEKRILMNRVS